MTQILFILLCLFFLFPVFLLLAMRLLMVDWQRLIKAATYGWTREDWGFLELCKVALMVAIWLKGW